ncbi:MAG TPA: outer membrane protein assembly factor BamA [Paracoccaceae bacterium]|nr:outer membrane protein assembly factor BamA [Paracoccaceae bacterium]
MATWTRSTTALLAALAILLGAAAAPPAAAQDAPVVANVQRILIEGARRLDEATIRAYLVVREGEPATADEINRSLRRLLDTGLFDDVTLSPLADGILVRVREAPFINRVAFEGNEALDDEVLRGSVQSISRAAFSRTAAERDAATLLDIYRRSGRYGATVEPVVIDRGEGRVDLVFEIDEGPVTGIRSIDFIGNVAFSDRRLRRAIETRESGVLSAIFGSGTYDPDRLEFDRELLRRFYLDRGYADFEVLSATAELTADREDFVVAFTMEEGDLYTFGPIDIQSGLPDLDLEALREAFQMQEGQTYSASDVDATIEELIFLVGQQGYAFVDIRPRAVRDDEADTVGVVFEIAEGPRVYIERIEIEGNTRTVDRVLRRQFRVAEGDAFNAREIQAARGRLRALGFFDRVDVATERGSADDRAVVNVEVQERLTGALQVGVGFSSADGPVGDVTISERNFLGRGQFLSARVNVTGDQQAFQFQFEEPALLDRDLAAGFSIGYVRLDRSDESSFEETNAGFRPYVGFPIAPDQRLELRYRLSADEIRDVTRDASPAIRDDEGTAVTSGPGLTWSWDRRNDPIEPTTGFLVELEQDFAGVGGDTAYTRSVGRVKGWQGLLEDAVIASLEFEAGAVFGLGDDLRVTDRFFLGGDEFRGFARDGIGPRDDSTITVPQVDEDGDVDPTLPRVSVVRDDALGGNYYAVARADVSFPLGLPEELGVYGGLFADVGTLWGLDETTYQDFPSRANPTVTVDDSAKLRASIGASLFIDSPFGPLRFNFAYPVEAEESDDREFFRFTVGTRF